MRKVSCPSIDRSPRYSPDSQQAVGSIRPVNAKSLNFFMCPILKKPKVHHENNNPLSIWVWLKSIHPDEMPCKIFLGCNCLLKAGCGSRVRVFFFVFCLHRLRKKSPSSRLPFVFAKPPIPIIAGFKKCFKLRKLHPFKCKNVRTLQIFRVVCPFFYDPLPRVPISFCKFRNNWNGRVLYHFHLKIDTLSTKIPMIVSSRWWG